MATLMDEVERIRRNTMRIFDEQMKTSGCEYCVTDTDGWVKPIEKNGHAFAWYNHLGWHLALRANGWRGNAPINFCPMCGRKLEGAES